MDFRTLQVTLAAIETGSMQEAASRFGVTQSAASQAVRRAEAFVGTDLLRRGSRPLAPTEAGRVLAREGPRLMQQLEAALAAMRTAGSMPEVPELKLGIVDSFAGTVGAVLVKELIEGSAALRLSAWSGLAHAHTESLLRHRIDVAITCDPAQDILDLDRQKLMTETYILVVPRLLEDKIARLPLRELLKRHALVRHSARSYMGLQVERHLRRLDVHADHTYEFDTSDALIAMVATGVAVSVTTPLCLLQGIAHAANVRVLPLPGPSLSRELLVMTRRGEFASPAARIASIGRTLLNTYVRTRLRLFSPWLESSLAIENAI